MKASERRPAIVVTMAMTIASGAVYEARSAVNLRHAASAKPVQAWRTPEASTITCRRP
jgi:hypothetical protein